MWTVSGTLPSNNSILSIAMMHFKTLELIELLRRNNKINRLKLQRKIY